MGNHLNNGLMIHWVDVVSSEDRAVTFYLQPRHFYSHSLTNVS